MIIDCATEISFLYRDILTLTIEILQLDCYLFCDIHGTLKIARLKLMITNSEII